MSATVVLIISGGIAAYRALELIRLLKKRGVRVVPVLTRAAQEFVTPLSAAALAGEKVHGELFSLTDEVEMGHIRLARMADVVVVAPASADVMAKAAHGLADDLATTILLATRAPVLMAPAMNPAMWEHEATRANARRLKERGVRLVGPEEGEVACGEEGAGRMSAPEDIAAAIGQMLAPRERLLRGRRVLITSGPTREPLDPVRHIANLSSGRMGHALAEVARELGADVVLVSGPVCLPPPAGVEVRRVETAREMLEAVESALPMDMAVFAAAVADWRPVQARRQKMKKGTGEEVVLRLVRNPDILATIARREQDRPALVAGFAAETEDVIAHARDKLRRKGADVIIANDVSPDSGILGGEETELFVITARGEEHLPRQSKRRAAGEIMRRLARMLREGAQRAG